MLQHPRLPLPVLRRCARLCCHAVKRVAAVSPATATSDAITAAGTRAHAIFPQLLQAMWRTLSQAEVQAADVDGTVGDLVRLATLDMLAQLRASGDGAVGGSGVGGGASGDASLHVALTRLLPLLCAPSLRIAMAATRHLATILTASSTNSNSSNNSTSSIIMAEEEGRHRVPIY